MDVQPDQEENEEKNDGEGVMSAGSSNDEGKSPVTVNEKEDIQSEMVLQDESSEGMKAAEEASAEQSEPGEDQGDELPSDIIIPTSEDLDTGEMNSLIQQPLSYEGSVDFEVNNKDDENDRLDLETPDRLTCSPVLEEEEDEDKEPTGAPWQEYDYEKQVELLDQLYEQRQQARQYNTQLQIKLAVFFRKKGGTLLENRALVSEQDYNEYVSSYTELKHQHAANSELIQQEAEELTAQSQEKVDQVEKKWRAYMALKQEVAVGILKRRLGKEAALAKVESVLASEQRLQDQLIQFRLTNIKLNIKIFKLDAEFFIMAEKAKKSNEELDPFDVMSREAQKEYERQRKLVKRVTRQILAARRLLPNIKEKLSWTERMIKERKPQLAVLDTLIAEKSKTLARTKQACNRLHRENLKLEESRGLLGNRVLLQDFEDTVDDCDRLEEKLQKLKCQEAETVLQRRKWKQT